MPVLRLERGWEVEMGRHGQEEPLPSTVHWENEQFYIRLCFEDVHAPGALLKVQLMGCPFLLPMFTGFPAPWEKEKSSCLVQSSVIFF